MVLGMLKVSQKVEMRGASCMFSADYIHYSYGFPIGAHADPSGLPAIDLRAAVRAPAAGRGPGRDPESPGHRQRRAQAVGQAHESRAPGVARTPGHRPNAAQVCLPCSIYCAIHCAY